MDFVTLKTFDNPIDAEITKGLLESEGIECYIFDENIMNLNRLYYVAMGGVKLVVKDEDAAKAKKILKKVDNAPLTDGKDRIIKCPKCGSTKLYTNFKSTKGLNRILKAILFLFFSIYPYHSKGVYKCKNCGTEFEKRDK